MGIEICHYSCELYYTTKKIQQYFQGTLEETMADLI